MSTKRFLRKTWYFIWEDDSWLSWLVNVVLAFILVKFIIYPALGFMLGTSFPVVAVISSSMEHNGLDFDSWWDQNKAWYIDNDISKTDLQNSIFKNGFNKGDIIVLKGGKSLEVGNVIVYNSDNYKYPIIHRIVQIDQTGSALSFKTKGDNNSSPDPAFVSKGQILGKSMFKIPLLGWIKILFTEAIGGM